MLLSEIIKTTDGRTKESKRAKELLERYGDCEVEYKKLDYWQNVDHILIDGEWRPLAYHYINNRFHCSQLIDYTSCSAKEWEKIYYNL